MSYATVTKRRSHTERKAFSAEVLQAHNACRLRHDAQPLELNEILCRQSQECAQHLISINSFSTSPYPVVGENVFVMKVSDPRYKPKGSIPVDAWYKQHEQTDLRKFSVNQRLLNFSQVVWKSTRLLGVGIARSLDKIVVVCQYMPPGNICGEYWRNVVPRMEVDETEANAEGDAQPTPAPVVDAEEVPVEPEEVPVEQEEVPVDPEEVPVEPEEVPVEPEEWPVEPEEEVESQEKEDSKVETKSIGTSTREHFNYASLPRRRRRRNRRSRRNKAKQTTSESTQVLETIPEVPAGPKIRSYAEVVSSRY